MSHYTYNPTDFFFDSWLYIFIILVMIMAIAFIIYMIYDTLKANKESTEENIERIKKLQKELTLYEYTLLLCVDASELYKIKRGQLTLEQQQIQEERAQLIHQLPQKKKEYRLLKETLSKQKVINDEEKLLLEAAELRKKLIESNIKIKNLELKKASINKENYETRRKIVDHIEITASAERDRCKSDLLLENSLLLYDSSFYKKLMKRVNKPEMTVPLTEKDWKQIQWMLYTYYPSLPNLFQEAGLLQEEQRSCYLLFFEIQPEKEEVLLDVSQETLQKMRQTIRQKLKVPATESSILTHLMRRV